MKSTSVVLTLALLMQVTVVPAFGQTPGIVSEADLGPAVLPIGAHVRIEYVDHSGRLRISRGEIEAVSERDLVVTRRRTRARISFASVFRLESEGFHFQRPTYPEGTKLRLTVPAHQAPAFTNVPEANRPIVLVGRLAEVRGDSIRLTGVARGEGVYGSTVVPLPAEGNLEVYTGTKGSVCKMATLGLVIGGTAGAVLGHATYEEGDGGFVLFDRGDVTAMTGVALGLCGLVIGTLVGLRSKTDRWEKASKNGLGLSMNVQSRCAAPQLAASIRF